MKNLIVKKVNFAGNNLLAIQDKDSKEIYTAINYVLCGLGFNDEQIRYNRDKWNGDKVISKGVRKFSYPLEKGGIQESYCINIKKLPLALAKINITPKIQEDKPKLAQVLEKYQDECADILAEAFIKNAKEDKTYKLTIQEMNAKTRLKYANIKEAEFIAKGAEKLKSVLSPEMYAVLHIQSIETIIGQNKIPRPQLEQKLIDATGIAEKVGVYSKSGNPHAQAVGAIISKLDITENEIFITAFEKNGHQGGTTQYTYSVLDKVKSWLEANNYPYQINNNTKSFKVFYEVAA